MNISNRQKVMQYLWENHRECFHILSSFAVYDYNRDYSGRCFNMCRISTLYDIDSPFHNPRHEYWLKLLDCIKNDETFECKILIKEL